LEGGSQFPLQVNFDFLKKPDPNNMLLRNGFSAWISLFWKNLIRR